MPSRHVQSNIVVTRKKQFLGTLVARADPANKLGVARCAWFNAGSHVTALFDRAGLDYCPLECIDSPTSCCGVGSYIHEE